MTGFTLAAVASIAAGLSIGAVATVGVTLAVQDHSTAPVQGPPPRSGPYLVEYGDRCFHGHCLPCNSKQSCLNQLPPALRP
jgi:Protein of unknown function (DUF2613)